MENIIKFKAFNMEFSMIDNGGLVKLYKESKWVRADWLNEWIGLGILNEFPQSGEYRWDNIVHETGEHVYWLPIPHNNIPLSLALEEVEIEEE